jgi:hypothetical protein
LPFVDSPLVAEPGSGAAIPTLPASSEVITANSSAALTAEAR